MVQSSNEMRDTFVQIFKDTKPEANFNSDTIQGDNKMWIEKDFF